ncbi:NAD(P)-binding protein [Camillea tinctor]|nr:NAD(P)-binding protein [Camillea tinctor]
MATSAKPYNLPADAVWLITGCSSGIGAGLAEFLATETTNRVVATARNPAALVVPDGPNVLKTRLDVTSRPSIDEAFDRAIERFGRVDVVVNNAGYTLMGDTEAAGDAEARALLDTNFWGAVDVTKRALPALRDGARGGAILFVSSFGGFCGAPGGAFYHASKFAMEGFAESVAKELDPAWGIHVCCLEPGGVSTEYLGSSMRRVPQRHPAYADAPTTVMLKMLEDPKIREGFATPSEVAQALWAMMSAGRKLPMRLPLGTDAWAMVGMEIEEVRKELEAWKGVSCSVGDQRGLDMIEELRKIG